MQLGDDYKRGTRIGLMTIDDRSGRMEVMLFSRCARSLRRTNRKGTNCGRFWTGRL
ncbi:hypothetical protein OH492_05695 [Vibrio chagasii]|nr:hypothetical protein [Vibrio chagasii]